MEKTETNDISKNGDLTQGEKDLLELLRRISDSIARSVKDGNRDFVLEDVLSDLGIDESDVKKAILVAISDNLCKQKGISEAKIHDLDIPFQPELTVVTNDEYEDITADVDTGGISFGR